MNVEQIHKKNPENIKQSVRLLRRPMSDKNVTLKTSEAQQDCVYCDLEQEPVKPVLCFV